MSDKKKEILSQLEQGKISANEAFTLLSRLSESDTADTKTEFRRDGEPHGNGPRQSGFGAPPPPATLSWSSDKPHSNATRQDGFGTPPPPATPSWVNDLVGDISGAMQDVVEGIKDMNIGTSISEFMSGTYGHHENTLHFTSHPITQGILKLAVIGKNAKVSVNGYDGSVIRVQCSYNARRADAEVLFHEKDGVYQVMYDESAMRSMEIICEVPYVTIKNLHVASKNGVVVLENIKAGAVVLYTKNDKLLAGNINCDEFVAQNRNDAIKVNALTAQNIHIETTNDKIQVENIRGQNAGLKTTNAGIKMVNMDVVNLQLHTTNNSLKLDKFLYDFNDWSGERTFEACTTNSNITFSVPYDMGIQLLANATGGKIVCKNYDMYFSETSKNHALGKNNNYDFSAKKLNVKLATTNASVKIR